MPTRSLRGRRHAIVVGALALSVSLASIACAKRRIPPRSSPRAAVADAFPEGGTIAETNAGHTAWALRTSDTLELTDGDGLIATTPWPSWAGWLMLDVAPDRTAALCSLHEVRLFDRGSEVAQPLSDVAADGDRSRCEGIATRDAGDVWMLLAPDPFRTLGSLEPVPRSRLCHHDGGGAWSCSELAVAAQQGSLVVTREHVWWLGNGSLFAIDAIAPGSEPRMVAAALGRRALRPSRSTETVLVQPSDRDPMQRPELVGIDGSRTSFEVDPESDRYVDVWLGDADRVLALDVVRDGATSCTSGFFSYSTGTSCTTTWFWTQLVVYELSAGAPVELAHASYEGGGQTSVAVERADGTFVAGDRWYRLP